MDLQKLYDSFISLIDSLSPEEMESETQRAIRESKDSYLLGGMNCFDEEDIIEKIVEHHYSSSFSKATYSLQSSCSQDSIDGSWGFSDERRLIA